MKKGISYIKIGAILFLIAEVVFYLLTRNTALPDDFHVFGLNLRIYGVIVASSAALGYGLSRFFASHKGQNLDDFDNFFLITLIMGVIGARVGFFLFDDGDKTFGHLLSITQGGLSIQGAVIGGLVGAVIYKLSFKKNIYEFLNLTMPHLLIAQAVGRLGNYFNQEIIGLPTNSNLGMKISENNIPLQYFGSERFLPVFLFESILLVIAYITYLSTRRTNNGIKFYLISYGLIRFFIQFFRIDHQNIVAYLDFPQILSILMIVFALIIFNKKSNIGTLTNTKKKV